MSASIGVDLSVVQTFHDEGDIARLTLQNITRLLAVTEAAGLTTEHVRVLDQADEVTDQIMAAHLRPQDRVIRCAHGDAGASRNEGVAASRGRFVAIVDGDDYYSERYFVEALRRLLPCEDERVVHPEYVIAFGALRSVRRHIDQITDPFPVDTCYALNPWASPVVASRRTFERCPYLPTHASRTGFGYEDWHWNMEVLAAGYRHVVAPRTALYYRRRAGSRVSAESSAGAVVPPSRFYSREMQLT